MLGRCVLQYNIRALSADVITCNVRVFVVQYNTSTFSEAAMTGHNTGYITQGPNQQESLQVMTGTFACLYITLIGAFVVQYNTEKKERLQAI